MSPIKKINIGEKFNHLTVIDDTIYRTKSGRIAYLFECDCGNKKIISASDVRSGHTKTCGCGFGFQKGYNLVGQKFGRLLVLEENGRTNAKQKRYKCQCDCGNIVTITSGALVSGTTKSCGCLQREKAIATHKLEDDLTNKKFGKLTALEFLPKSKSPNGKAGWKCQCDCGNITFVSTHRLIDGLVSSCGCIKSKGELKITTILKENNITNYISQYHIYYNNHNYYYDFALFDKNNNIYFVEYDGKQHFSNENAGWGESLEDIQERDNIKNQYAKENNIPIIRIPYTHYNNLNIEDLILSTSTFIISN